MSVISKKSQVTIPVGALRAAGLEPGDDVRIVPAGPGRLELVRTDELIDRFAGAFGEETYPAGYLETLRDEWR